MRQVLSRHKTGRKKEFKRAHCTASGCKNEVPVKGEECKICYEANFPEMRNK
jgi:hypothetical protein